MGIWCGIQCDIIGNNLVNIVGTSLVHVENHMEYMGTPKFERSLPPFYCCGWPFFPMLLLAIEVCCYVTLLHIKIFFDVLYFALSCEQRLFWVKVHQIFILTMMLWFPQRNLSGKIVEFHQCENMQKLVAHVIT